MTDDDTRVMPVNDTAPEDEPTTVLPTDAQTTTMPTMEDTPDSAATVPTFEQPMEPAGHPMGQTAMPVSITKSNGDLVIRPSGPSGATIALGVCIALIGVVTVIWGLQSPMNLWGVDPQLFVVGTIGGPDTDRRRVRMGDRQTGAGSQGRT